MLIRDSDEASARDAHYKERPGEWSITQGTNVHYMQYVNKEGHGPQFIGDTVDELADAHQKELNRLVEDLVRLL